jgi:hypothetical protein
MHHIRCYNRAWAYRVISNNMYRELSTHDIAHELSSNEDNGFSYKGALALAEYLEQYEEDTGERIELDTVALRCEYNEYESAWDAMKEYQPEDMPTVDNSEGMDLLEIEEASEQLALEWLQDHTTVIPFEGGIIIQAF